MQKIAVIGAGYVGLVTATCLADMGNQVICVDNDRQKLLNLKKGIMPIYEPGLKEMVLKNKKAKRLVFSSSIKEATEKSLVIFISVNTPPLPDGGADLSAVERVSSEIAKAMKEYKVIVCKSTVPAETHARVKKTVEMLKGTKVEFDVASNPEFLREGHAVNDTLHPDRIVIGVESKRTEEIMRKLYSPLNAPIVVTNITTAEIIKHACNSFLSIKISYINAVANICERVNADVEKVAEGMGYDKRIGRQFLNAGAGFGGNCFPKDLDAFIHLAEKKGYDFEMLKAARKINYNQKKIVLKKIEDALWILKGKTIGVLGLSFKAETDDTRNSIAIDMIEMLQAEGAKIKAYDPQAMGKARKELKNVVFAKNPYDAAKGSDCLLIMTEWQEFRKLDLKKVKSILRQPVIVDGRNLFEPQAMKEAGFVYKCIGRS
jgi:UDPglucose 6-dehydrogenase